MIRLVSLALLLVVAGCAKEPPAQAPQFAFSGGAPFFVVSERVAVVDASDHAGDLLEIPGTASADPKDVVASWVRDRLAVSPGPSQLTVRILQAQVDSDPLPVTQGLEGLIRTEPIEKMTARLAVELEYRTAEGVTRSSARASASQEVLENASASERERAYFSLLEALAKEFDKTMSAEAARFLPPAR